MMFFAELQDVCLADKRLTAREHVEVYAKLLALCNNTVQILEAQVQLVTILCSPAASAVQVAGRGRIHQDQPRNIAAILFTVCANGLGSVDHRLKHQVEQRHLQNIRIQLVDQLVQVLVPLFIRICEEPAEHRIGFFRKCIRCELLNYVQRLRKSLLTVFVNSVKHDIKSLAECKPCCFVCKTGHFVPLPIELQRTLPLI